MASKSHCSFCEQHALHRMPSAQDALNTVNVDIEGSQQSLLVVEDETDAMWH